ncbi:MAG: adenylate/guanylate cyclase domain-containing protein, partial [Pseudobdellovibrio sp.]
PDAKLLKIINHYKDKIVLASGAESLCGPLSRDCHLPPTKEAFKSIEKWKVANALDLNLQYEVENPILNIPEYNEVARYSGFSISQANADGIFRDTFLRYKFAGGSYNSLAVASVTAVQPDIELPDQNKIYLNFKTDIQSKHSVSAADILLAEQDSEKGRELKRQLTEKLKDQVLVLGVTATSAGDFHTTAIGLQSGPAIVLTTIDNLWARDYFVNPGLLSSVIFILFIAGLFFVIQRIKSNQSSKAIILIFSAFFFLLLILDAVAFKNKINLPTVWSYLFIAIYSFSVIFEKYWAVEVQKDFIKGAFSKYISPDYVNELLSNPEKLKIGGQRKDLSIMFSDIRNFTTFSEKMDAQLLGEFLHEYLDAMTDIVFNTRGTLDKYIGDAVMAFWGDPLKATDHGHSSALAAMQMIKWVNEHREYFKNKYQIDLQIGIGINTAVVSVGNMGSSKSLGYTVIGDGVNLASRLEGATKFYGVSIIATEATFDNMTLNQNQWPQHRYIDLLKVKGKNEPVKIAQIFENPVPDNFVDEFNKARELYLLKQFRTAAADFRRANELFKAHFSHDDSVSLMYISRCEEFLREAPSNDWDGSFKLDSK